MFFNAVFVIMNRKGRRQGEGEEEGGKGRKKTHNPVAKNKTTPLIRNKHPPNRL